MVDVAARLYSGRVFRNISAFCIGLWALRAIGFGDFCILAHTDGHTHDGYDSSDSQFIGSTV